MVRIERWVCNTCNKKWIYPIDTCLYCRGKIAKQVGTKAKVIGVTEVFVPSPLHPIIPYHVLMLQDEHGNKMPKKTIKGYAVGDTYEDKPSSDANTVAIVKVKYDFEEAVKEALWLIGGLSVDKNTKILIKPNISLPGASYLGICTNEKVLDGLLAVLKEKGVPSANITVAEQSFFVPLEKAAEKSGILEILKKYGLGLTDISRGVFIGKKEREFSFSIAKIAYDADIIINLPVIKTDMVLGLDGAFENLTRFLAKENFESYARDRKKAVQALAVLPKVLPQMVILGDGTIGMQGNGPGEYGEPGFFNMLFGARNPVAHDTVVAEILCLPTIPYVELAGKLGVGEYDLKKINVIGNELDSVKRDIKQPIGSKLIKRQE